jgi:hypothetical protein
MKLLRMFAAVVAVAVLAGVAYVNQATEPPGAKMASAADKFLGTLKEEQKARATFAFDDKERTNWHFVPRQDKNKMYTRKGLPLQDMTKEQRAAALELLRAGTSADGYTAATTIMSLEAILHELEKAKAAMVRNPEWYFFTVFGTPSKTGKWGWRVEGHHLALNFTIDKGAVVSSTPAFFGANPATVMGGDRKGLRTLPDADDLAKELFNALDDDQKKVALQSQQFPEIKEESVKPPVGAPVGLAAAKMNDKQKMILRKLIEAYVHRMPAEIAQEELRQVREGGVDKIHFAFAGGAEAGKPHTYRVQGPTFVIEFLNLQPDSAQNPANHIHSVWRNIKGDFGLVAAN